MDIQLLANLLRPPEEEEEGLDEGGGPSPYANPGAISSSSSANGEGATGGRSGASKGEAIWSEEEVGEGGGQDYDDPREEPEYELVYKQAVSTEDVFLGMSNKTPTTASCEDIIVRVRLPGVVYKDVDLVVTKQFLDCRCPRYRLGLHLPHQVDPDIGSAKWLGQEQVLEVTLRLVRTLDELNH